jgi:SAM-dependent methyltransferase
MPDNDADPTPTVAADDVTGYFGTRLSFDPARATVWGHVARYLQRWIPHGASVLDLACGYGDFVAAVRSSGRRVGMDLHPDLATFLPPDVTAEVGDATDLRRFDSASFQVVFASNFLEHLDHSSIDRCLAEIYRVLNPGGRLILVQPNFRLAPRTYFDDYTHRTIFTDRSLGDLLAARGFEPVHTEARFLPMTMKSRLRGGSRLVPLYLRLPYRPLAGQMLHIVRRPG